MGHMGLVAVDSRVGLAAVNIDEILRRTMLDLLKINDGNVSPKAMRQAILDKMNEAKRAVHEEFVAAGVVQRASDQ